jgi:hypothetical protein
MVEIFWSDLATNDLKTIHSYIMEDVTRFIPYPSSLDIWT